MCSHELWPLDHGGGRVERCTILLVMPAHAPCQSSACCCQFGASAAEGGMWKFAVRTLLQV